MAMQAITGGDRRMELSEAVEVGIDHGGETRRRPGVLSKCQQRTYGHRESHSHGFAAPRYLRSRSRGSSIGVRAR
jgi:hypothetical protein